MSEIDEQRAPYLVSKQAWFGPALALLIAASAFWPGGLTFMAFNALYPLSLSAPSPVISLMKNLPRVLQAAVITMMLECWCLIVIWLSWSGLRLIARRRLEGTLPNPGERDLYVRIARLALLAVALHFLIVWSLFLSGPLPYELWMYF